MNMYKKIVKQQRKEIAKLTLEQQRQILNLYDDAIGDLSKKAARSRDKSLQKRWKLDYIKELKRVRSELDKELKKQVINSTKKASEIGTKAEQLIMKEIFQLAELDTGKHFTTMFSQVQDNVVRDIKHYQVGFGTMEMILKKIYSTQLIRQYCKRSQL